MDFILYEFFLGLGDAVPAFLLCLFLCGLHCVPAADVRGKKIFRKENYMRIISISCTFFLWKMFGYVTGIVDNEMTIYPVPVVIWTFIFGAVIGFGYCLINDSFIDEGRKVVRMFLTIGMNWIWFNCYIGLIAANTFLFMVLRSGFDVLAILAGSLLAEVFIQKIELIE